MIAPWKDAFIDAPSCFFKLVVPDKTKGMARFFVHPLHVGDHTLYINVANGKVGMHLASGFDCPSGRCCPKNSSTDWSFNILYISLGA